MFHVRPRAHGLRDLLLRLASLGYTPREIADMLDDYGIAVVGAAELDLPELYISISYISQLREIDLAWHQASQSRACDVLRALEKPCAALPEKSDEATTP